MLKRILTLSFAALLLAVTPAFAHTHPVSMVPAADVTVDPAPDSIVMHFSGGLEPKFSSITLSDSTGHVVNTSVSVVSGDDAKTMTLPLPKLVPGVYTVSWVGVSTDTHRSTGEYKFTVAGTPPPPVVHAH
jgi:methionine-rich copper-binding protein CopC